MIDEYKFVDITIYYKTKKGYLNLTDYDLISKENPIMNFNSNSQFVIELCPFLNEKTYISEIELDEILDLAGIHDNNFKRRFEISDIEETQWLLGTLCSKKILEYKYGKIKKTKETSEKIYYDFKRQSYQKEGEGKKRIYKTILTKGFYENIYE